MIEPIQCVENVFSPFLFFLPMTQRGDDMLIIHDNQSLVDNKFIQTLIIKCLYPLIIKLLDPACLLTGYLRYSVA